MSLPGYIPRIGERDLDKIVRGVRNIYEQVGTGANNLVQLDDNAKLPAVDGSQLTNLPTFAPLSGSLVQAQYSRFKTYTSGATNFPNVVGATPQNTYGDQFMSVSITPKSAANTLIIDALIMCSTTSASLAQCALFQDSTAGGLAQNAFQISAANQKITLVVHHEMLAGTTSATTFKLRAGSNSGGTFYVNGDSTGATGTVQSTYIKVIELAA